MILGFISLLLTFYLKYNTPVCVSKALTKGFLPCKKRPDDQPPPDDDDLEVDTRLMLLWYDHRCLAGDGPPKGYEALITIEGLHQLHMISGRAKIHEWKSWEKDILQQQATAHDPSRFRLTKESSLVKSHANRSGLPIILTIQLDLFLHIK